MQQKMPPHLEHGKHIGETLSGVKNMLEISNIYDCPKPLVPLRQHGFIHVVAQLGAGVEKIQRDDRADSEFRQDVMQVGVAEGRRYVDLRPPTEMGRYPISQMIKSRPRGSLEVFEAARRSGIRGIVVAEDQNGIAKKMRDGESLGEVGKVALGDHFFKMAQSIVIRKAGHVGRVTRELACPPPPIACKGRHNP